VSFVYYNPNPEKKTVGDCVIRGLTILLGDTWENVYTDLCMQGAYLHDMPNSNAVWGEYLRANGFEVHTIPNTCPYCYTVKQFCREHPSGVFLLATGEHVIAVVDGDYYDTADTGNEVPIYYWRKER